ncbi:radical SAM protein [Prevotella nigrescens]|uniref:radical SAM protein n=1 Tax=Prevotella nigrescens TaxID=28133 RepID=UPI002430C9CF|nr:radical SAM protein [Prevotella nigrescens]
MNIYKLLNVYQRIKSPKVKLLGILALHIGKRRYLSINIDPVMSCNLRCKMCYFSDAETAKKMRGKFSSDDLEAIAKSLFPRALRLQIGCGSEPTVSQNLLLLVQLGKQYGVKHITITTNGNLLTYEKLHKLVENGLTEITLSAHGFTKNTYESLMTNGKFDLFTALIENLARIRTDFPDFRIRVNYTVNADNAEELIQLKEVFKDAKPNVVQIRPIQRIGKSSYNNFSLQTIKDNYNSWIMPVVAYCQQENITCLYPTPESLEMLETVNGAEEKSNSLVDSLPYFYIAPYEGWKEKIDPYNESFEKYSQRTRRISTILRELVGIGTVKGERSRTKSLNYQIK